MTAIGSPMGVVAGIIPVTNPTSTVAKCLAAVKSEMRSFVRRIRATQRAGCRSGGRGGQSGSAEGAGLLPVRGDASGHGRTNAPSRRVAGVGYRRSRNGPSRLFERETNSGGWCGQRPCLHSPVRQGREGSRLDGYHVQILRQWNRVSQNSPSFSTNRPRKRRWLHSPPKGHFFCRLPTRKSGAPHFYSPTKANCGPRRSASRQRGTCKTDWGLRAPSDCKASVPTCPKLVQHTHCPGRS